MNTTHRLLLAACCLACLPASANPPPRFPAGSVWHQNIASAPLHPNSTSMINTLVGLGGWGNGNKF